MMIVVVIEMMMRATEDDGVDDDSEGDGRENYVRDVSLTMRMLMMLMAMTTLMQ